MLLLLLHVSAAVNAQNAGTTSQPTFDILPKSPEAAAISKYGSIPVGLTSGVPNISIPIYNISLKGLNVPISLNYHSSGVKVNEQATNVGLGWSLQSGGVVTETIYGRPDFQSGGWISSNPKTPQSDTYKEIFENGLTTTTTPVFQDDTTYQFYQNVLTGKADSQPDLFYINYLGKSIKFYFDQSGNYHLMPYRRVKIDIIYPGTIWGPGAFVLTDENDVKYTFAQVDRTTTTSDSPTDYNDHGMQHVTDNLSYFITKIVTPAGDSVKYNYDGTIPRSFSPQTISFKNQTIENRYEAPGGTDCVITKPDDRAYHSTTELRTPMITSIVSSKGDSIVFNYNTYSRFDLVGAQSLAGVMIYKQNNPSFSKSFQFVYNYFYAGGTLPPGATPSFETQDNYRLRLDSVKESGKGPYVFTYNSESLPARLSLAQDHWGFYNGATTNTTLIPIDSLWGFYTGGNREPHPLKCQAGILTSIKYPTGGKTAFTYEPNANYMTKVFYVPVTPKTSAAASTTVVNNINFTVPAGAHDFKVTYLTASPAISDLEPMHVFRTIQLKQGATLLRQFSGSNINLEDLSPLTAGNYTFRMCIDSNNIGVNIQLYYRLNGETDTVSVSKNYQVGGLHIKATDDYSSDGVLAMNTSYDYSSPADSTKSSNTINSEVVYHYYTHGYAWDADANVFKSCDFKSQSISNAMALSGDGVENNYFSDVKVFKTNKAGSGYTVYHFLAPGGDGVAGWPFSPHVQYDWYSEQLSFQKEYKYNSATTSYNLIHKVENAYQENSYSSNPALNPPHEGYTRGIKIGVVRPALAGVANTGTTWLIPQYFVSTYDLRTTWFYQKGKIETVYDPLDSNKKAVTTTNFFYDNPDHIEMTRQEVSKSTGEHYNVLMRYPKDYNSSYPYNSSPVVEKRVMINDGTIDRLTKAELTLYKDQAGAFPTAYYSLKNSASVAPSAIPVYTGSAINGNYEKRGDYSYDTQNNMVSILKDNTVATSYQWGYNKEYPVAECKNATNAEFYFEGYEESSTSSSTAHTGNRATTNAAVNWNRPNSRAYVIDYWCHTSSGWQYKQDNYTGSSYTMSGGDAYDDVRIYPKDAQITTYTYAPGVGVTSIMDTKGQTSYYEYDSFQRLVNVKDQYGNIVKHTDYHYANN